VTAIICVLHLAGNLQVNPTELPFDRQTFREFVIAIKLIDCLATHTSLREEQVAEASIMQAEARLLLISHHTTRRMRNAQFGLLPCLPCKLNRMNCQSSELPRPRSLFWKISNFRRLSKNLIDIEEPEQSKMLFHNVEHFHNWVCPRTGLLLFIGKYQRQKYQQLSNCLIRFNADWGLW